MKHVMLLISGAMAMFFVYIMATITPGDIGVFMSLSVTLCYVLSMCIFVHELIIALTGVKRWMTK